MTACTENRDDLALMAGGDLESPGRERRLREHVGACAGCLELLAQLSSDRELFAAAGEAELAGSLPGLAADVVARLERDGEGAGLPARAGSRRRGRAALWIEAAAVVLVAGLAGTWAVERLPLADGSAGAGPAVTAVVADGGGALAGPSVPADESLPLTLRRGPGSVIELAWTGDGREAVSGVADRPGRAYTVLASSSPEDFSGAEAIAVAGRRLVANGVGPARPVPGGSLTYYKVQ